MRRFKGGSEGVGGYVRRFKVGSDWSAIQFVRSHIGQNSYFPSALTMFRHRWGVLSNQVRIRGYLDD